MYVEKFIEQYGKFEIKKMQKLGLLKRSDTTISELDEE